MGNDFTESQSNVQLAAALLRSSKYAIALTGAGISTPSGIPDFRSAGSGLWTRYDPMEVASLSVFRYHPEKFFAWMRPLALGIIQAKPNPAHFGLARLEQAGFLRAIITQNIDGLHHRAGSQRVLEVHGSLRTLTCIGCYRQYNAAGYIEPYLESGEIPRCPSCHHILKPDVVLFEEQLPIHTWLEAQEACDLCDLMIVSGSSLEVMPVAELPLRAVENEAALILINQTPTYIDERADVLLRGDVAVIIPSLVIEVLGE